MRDAVKRRVLIRPMAEQDLDDQAEYLAAHRNIDLAQRFYRAADETFQLLATQPRMGKATHYANPFLAGVRMFPLKIFSRHLVFYRPLEDGVEIVRVLHGAQDLESLFEAWAPGS